MAKLTKTAKIGQKRHFSFHSHSGATYTYAETYVALPCDWIIHTLHQTVCSTENPVTIVTLLVEIHFWKHKISWKFKRVLFVAVWNVYFSIWVILLTEVKACTMQSSAEGLVTFLPHTLPFLCQPVGGLASTVVIQSSVPAAAAPVQLVQQQRCAFFTVCLIVYRTQNYTVAKACITVSVIK